MSHVEALYPAALLATFGMRLQGVYDRPDAPTLSTGARTVGPGEYRGRTSTMPPRCSDREGI